MVELLQEIPALFFAFAAGLGLIIGSFLNVVILRLPARMEYEWRCECRELLELQPDEEQAPPGLVKPRSSCPKCGIRSGPLKIFRY